MNNVYSPNEACGKCLHKDCADRWAKSRTPPTCPFCRTPWESVSSSSSSSASEGYVNLGQLQGISTTRQPYFPGGFRRGRYYRYGGYRAGDRDYRDDDDDDDHADY